MTANVDFFAAEADQRAVIDFLFSSTDIRIFELHSQINQELREFCSTNELADQFGSGVDVLLELWSPSVMHDLTIKRFGKEQTFRHSLGGGGLMQLYLGGIYGRVITKSHFGHQSQARAQKWNLDEGVNWAALKTLSNRIQYHIRKRLAVSKVPGRPVLAQALELVQAGYTLKEEAQTTWQYEL